jgi:hypothetical protein
MKQTIGNACGTIGLLHIAGNSPGVPRAGKSKPYEELIGNRLISAHQATILLELDRFPNPTPSHPSACQVAPSSMSSSRPLPRWILPPAGSF